MNRTRMVQLLCCLAIIGVFSIGMVGCKDDETTSPGPSPALSSSSTSLTAAPGGNTNATLSGGTAPYAIQTGPDTTIARASISGGTVTVNAIGSGYTSIVVKDTANASVRIGISVTGPIPITTIVFPLLNAHAYVYTGYAINTSANGSTRIPDPNNVYRTSWTLSGPLPGPNPPAGSFLIRDSTTFHLGASDTTVIRSLVIIRNPVTGSFTFFQTLGPFFRALGVLPLGRQDTVRAITIADPSVGIGGTWTAFDSSSYTNATGSTVRLQIVGSFEAGETITDSAHQTYNALRFRTARNVFVTTGSNTVQVVTNATTSRLWLVKDIGPVQVHIAEDTENIGQFRVMKQRNF